MQSTQHVHFCRSDLSDHNNRIVFSGKKIYYGEEPLLSNSITTVSALRGCKAPYVHRSICSRDAIVVSHQMCSKMHLRNDFRQLYTSSTQVGWSIEFELCDAAVRNSCIGVVYITDRSSTEALHWFILYGVEEVYYCC
jgi:hypothetical protein